MIGFCTSCRARTRWNRVTGWLFHRQLVHERCADCGCAVGATALDALLELARQYHLRGSIDRDIQRLHRGIVLDARIAAGERNVTWSEPATPDPAPVVVPSPPRAPVAPFRPRVRPGPGFRP